MSYKDQLILAAYMCDAEKVEQLVNQKEFDNNFMEDMGFYTEAPFPLYYFTILAKKVFYDDFRDKVMPLVTQIRQNCDKLTIFWREKFGIDIDKIDINYKTFSDYFYSEPEDETSLEDFSEYEHIHARQIDYDLFEAAVHFDFEKVRYYLSLGANPEFGFYTSSDIIEEGSDDEFIISRNILGRIGDECSFLCTCEVFPLYENYYNHKGDPISEQDIDDLIGWAAHEEMYRLLTENIEE